uniref:protein-serine/threonine phosphatase n=1 Tax=Molossus molossus TaxID=27622 RepID=A0A7J8D2M0_MOLMO|nr:slingshot protein phosphatase 2 [Molossus molossus]
MVVVSTNGRQDTEESIVLGMDFSSNDSSTCTMGLVLPLWSDTLIHLDGDGGFSVSTDNRVHIFKPVSVQAMWSALQSLHKACEVARMHNYYPGSLFLTWVSYYESHINSDQSSVNEWNAMQDVQSHRPDSPALFTDIPTERERTERLIKTKLREIMMQKDLENITSKEIRTELEMQMVCNLREFKEFIDNEMIVILGQMDSPTQIFEHVFLGSEWNASNLEDLQNRGVRYILNVTREIDNFFPGVFEYHNIRVYDEEATDLLAYWNDTYKFISKAKKHGSKCLVHCKMGVSRSASTVIAYAMKEYGWNLDRAYDYVKERRTVTKPNPSFMRQLEEYQGILLASKQRHNKLWRSHSDSDLSDHHEPICKPGLELNKKEITTSADQIAEAISELVSPDIFTQSHSENAISVKEIVTEIESISQGIGQIQLKGDILSNPCHTPKKNTTHEMPLERTQAPENKPGNLEPNEGSCPARPELAKDSGRWDPEGCLTLHSSTTDLEEEEPAEGEQELWGPGMHPGAKWYPGSVRRATLEFEERLRQEQEYHSATPTCTSLSTRKNSKNDSSMADLVPKGKSDEATPEHSSVPREPEMNKGKRKCSGFEAGSLAHCEQDVLVSAPKLLDFHSLPAPQECPESETRTKQQGVLKEQETVVSCQGSETQMVPLPKEIEIIEYTQTVTSPSHTWPGAEIATSVKSGEQGLRKVKVEKSITVLCALDENLNRTLCPSQVSLYPKVLPLPHSSSPEHKRRTDPTSTLSSPGDWGHSPATALDTAAPFVSHTTHVPSANLDYLHPQTVVHLEGFTEQSSTTDFEPCAEQGSWEESQEGPLSGGNEVPYKGSQLSSEDLSLISKLSDNIGKFQEKLDPSPVACRLSHSSSSDNIKGLSHSPSVVKERTKETESRAICQVGRTKPSQMRRSASLAKLGYLDLCKDCLLERDPVSSESPHLKLLQPFIRTDSGMHAMEAQEPPENPDAPQNPEPTKYFIEQLKTTECIAQSKPVERPLVQYAKEFGYSQQCLLPKAGPELTSSEGGLPLLQTQGLPCAGPAPGLAVAPRQQHGRTHPLRRLKKANDKKRTTNPFYNTM